MIPYGVWFNAAQTLCGNMLFILPSIEIRENKMMLDFDGLLVADCRDYAQLYVNNINLDLDMGAYQRNDYLFTPKHVGERISAPVTYCTIDSNWKAPDFEKIRQTREDLSGLGELIGK